MGRHERRPECTIASGITHALTLRGASELCEVESRPFVTRLIERFGDTPLALIDQQWALAAERALYANASAATRNRQFWTPLIAIMNAMAECGRCARPQLARPHVRTSTPSRLLSPAEAQRLVQSSAPHLARQLKFILCTGARPGEVFSLRRRDLDVVTGAVTLPASDGPCTVLLPAVFVGELNGSRESAPHVFEYRRGTAYAPRHGSGGQNKTALRAAARRAHLAPLTLLDLRHTWAVWFRITHGYEKLVRAGRWANERSAARYRRLSESDTERVGRALNEPLEVCELFRRTVWLDLEDVQ